MAKIITVVGATGAQGKGVVNAFINDPAYHVRALTRNISSEAAQSLASRDAEVVAADLNDQSTLHRAFAGSHIVYAVTNFFEPFITHQSATKAIEIERQQGINLATAAAATPTLEHYIWSTLPNGRAISAGKYLVPHFEAKNRVDAYIRTHLPALLAKTTFLWVTWYHSNYTFPMFTPYWIPTTGKHLQLANYAPDTPILTIGDVSVNIGPFVRAAVEQRGKAAGGKIVLAAIGEEHTAGEMLQLWAKEKGTRAQFVRVSGEDFREAWPLWGEEIGGMMEFWDGVRERAWTDPEGATVLAREDLGVTGLQGLAEAYRGLEL